MEKKTDIDVRELAEQFFDEELKKIDDDKRREEIELEKETYIGVWVRGYRAGKGTKLRQAEDKIKELESNLQTANSAYEMHKKALVHYKKKKQSLQKENERLKAQSNGWRPLLEEVMNKHGSIILMHDNDFYEKIKTFLYGE